MSLASLGIMAQTPAAAPDPLPTDLPLASSIAYWFASEFDVFTDASGTIPAADGDPVYVWGNQSGHATYTEDAIQSTLANRPTFRTGGANGKPYLECNAATPQFFEDLAQWTYPTGTTAMGSWLNFAFVAEWPSGISVYQPIFGSTPVNGGKAGLFLTSGATPRIRIIKNGNLGGVHYSGKTNAIVTNADATNGARAWANINGYQPARFGDLSNAVSTAISGVQFLRCTGISAASGQYFDGRIYEVIAWNTNSLLNATTREEVNAYFRSKYNIAAETVAPY